jgi:hypothetical protein
MQTKKELDQQFQNIKSEIADIDIAFSGSITERYMPCGKKGCKCQGQPPELHGPYYQWTAKINGITKTIRLQSSAVNSYKKWIGEGKRLDKLIAKWKEISLERVREEQLNAKN